ncbi:transcription termination/antitermination protein NusG [Corynebacterium felinum]|uniref:Transcription termination/antitermination protein NusG n=1 Tax=Corynebacterium felinum TaxID=131318 RepID=A0ABU2BB42_9CORY|nr:transcription termination/antitermination protein NusG [Corynebacterium felinum]MDF5820897.1 transcription termination/antitermination protein NusG [Corynebacterium felinum]MDR7354589.1 transcriptional antiterminator NusG [Corynebacterium felinum]WJY93955.1 hypothetical protein CFELI_01560 [Corynebacterium felinum]
MSEENLDSFAAAFDEATDAAELNESTEAQDIADSFDASIAEPEAEAGEEQAEPTPSEAAAAEANDADGDYKARLRAFTRELKKQPGQWYIIQCYSGYENKVKTNLDMRAQTLEVEDSIYEIVVPVEQAVEIKDGKRKIVKRKLLPGYVLVRMDINDRAWSVVRETPGVTSFVGNEGNATPVKHRDVAKFLMPQDASAPTEGEGSVTAEGEKVVAMPTDVAKAAVTVDFEEGEAVTILTGALAGVSATISSIDVENSKLQVLVSIFGRETPVDVTFDQVEKVS